MTKVYGFLYCEIPQSTSIIALNKKNKTELSIFITEMVDQV